MIKIRRLYDPPQNGEGYRILVDRLWPRGVSKAKVPWDLWMKEIAPGNELRSWYHHDPGKWDEFRKRYAEELSRNPDPVAKLKALEKQHGTITLLYASTERERNNAVALRDHLTSLSTTN